MKLTLALLFFLCAHVSATPNATVETVTELLRLESKASCDESSDCGLNEQCVRNTCEWTAGKVKCQADSECATFESCEESICQVSI